MYVVRDRFIHWIESSNLEEQVPLIQFEQFEVPASLSS